MKKNKYFIVLILLTATTVLSGCEKYLEEKSDKTLAVPSGTQDYQALLDNYNTMNTSYAGSGEVSSDDFYLSDADFSNLFQESDKRMYTWQPGTVFATAANGNDWLSCYSAIYVSNSILDDLAKQELPGSGNIKGQALVFRASRYLDAVQIWALPYDAGTASTDLGLPLRLDPDFNTKSVRASVQQTYDQIIQDLLSAISLLPVTPLKATRPSKPAAYGLLARAYLFMGDYNKALASADSALALKSSILDFNTLNASASYPVADLNSEVIFSTYMYAEYQLVSTIAKISPDVYSSYSSNDLRKTIFFRTNTDGSIRFKGNYSGSSGKFTGIATDELYLIRAECNARLGKAIEAIHDLNTILVKRWKTGTFVPMTAADPATALGLVLQERRKELLLRGLRWADIKRLNKLGANLTLTRTTNGQSYTLPPNDLRSALAIPEDVISLSGMEQNKR